MVSLRGGAELPAPAPHPGFIGGLLLHLLCFSPPHQLKEKAAQVVAGLLGLAASRLRSRRTVCAAPSASYPSSLLRRASLDHIGSQPITQVLSMIRGLAVEYARYGIRANSILPGWIATDMTQGAQQSDKFNDQVIRRVPFRRWGEGDDFSGIAVYLASNASKFHTGDSIVIDGGYTIF